MAFYDEIDNSSNFSIGFSTTPKEDFGIFGRGYYKSAEKLAEYLLGKGHFADHEAYPVVFLYRHSFELYLKNVIYSTILLSAFKRLSEIDTKLYNTHGLKPLAEKAAKILQTLFQGKDLLTFSNEMILKAKEFDDLDPDSYSYRYPINVKGGLSTKPNQTINLESFVGKMNWILEELDTVDFGIDMETDHAQEIYEIAESIRTEVME